MSVTEPARATGTWVIDKTHSSIGYAIEHNGESKFRGSFRDVDAKLEYGESGVKISGSVNVESVDLTDETRRGHVFSPDFFDTERFPTVDFESSEVRYENGEVVIDGKLTLRGETKPVTVRGTIGESFENIAGGKSLVVRLHTTIDRTQYGLDWQMQMPDGRDVLGNEVHIEADLELVDA
ncbi:MAG: YceI family protein [Solirubrobacterales bacterium]